MEKLEGTVPLDCESIKRLDSYVSDTLSLISRSQLKLRFLSATINGKNAKLSKSLNPGDSFVLELEDEKNYECQDKAENIALEILYEDENVIVVNKAQGMVVHPAQGNWSGTLVNALLGYSQSEDCENDSEEETGLERRGIVHRLDKDTSGVIITAKNVKTQEFLEKQFRERMTKKTYYAIVKGRPVCQNGTIEDYIIRDPKNRKRFISIDDERGKHAVTNYSLVSSVSNYGNKENGKGSTYSLLKLKPKTGRTHQLRVHCKKMNMPIVGDPIYSRVDVLLPEASLMLHAHSLEITLPGKSEPSVFVAPFPNHFLQMIEKLGLKNN